jgi:hypothetical protein
MSTFRTGLEKQIMIRALEDVVPGVFSRLTVDDTPLVILHSDTFDRILEKLAEKDK